ncbi:MAG: GRRM system radical SAM/SPASM domain protein [Saprospiraceae bacterium]|nr:GRRM system radical SAM/SPASM domain protein [Saprospiraceae bacterium]
MTSNLGPVELMVIQGSPFCNINCKYCYLPDRLNKKKISKDTVFKIIERLVQDNLLGKEISFIWHAGEPLAVPLGFYQDLFSIISQCIPSSTQVHHHMQTNATLLNDHWCTFIKEHDIKIGVSVDGPKELNDLNRLTRSGKSTFTKVMNGIDHLKKHNIRFHTIAVITQEALSHPNQIYDFFKSIGVTKLGLNIEEIEGINTTSSLSLDPASMQLLTNFYEVLYARQLDDNDPVIIRELDDAKRKILQIPLDYFSNHGITQQNNPYQIISVDIDGNFTSYSPELLGQKDEQYQDFILGNVHEESFLDAAEKPLFKTLRDDIFRGIRNCEKSCPYFSFCGGGAPANKYYENGSFSSTETLQCRYSIQTPLEIITRRLESAMP